MKTVLDLALDRVKRGVEEVTLDLEGFTPEQVEAVERAAMERGLHAAFDGRWMLVREL